MRIWGLCGLAGSGKDTAADFLVQQGFVKVAFADPLKRICKDVFNFSDEQLWGPSEKRNAPDRRFPRTDRAAEFLGRTMELLDKQWQTAVVEEFGEDVAQHFLTTRYGLQKLGTEWGRDCYPNIWAEYAVRVAKTLLESTFEGCEKKGYHPLYYSAKNGLWQGHNVRQVEGVVISDVRFLNEIRAIKQAGGKVFRLLRGQGLEGVAGQHLSERELQSIPLGEFDGIIDNCAWTLEELKACMTRLAEKEK